jgi:hypothetical protein
MDQILGKVEEIEGTANSLDKSGRVQVIRQLYINDQSKKNATYVVMFSTGDAQKT